MNARHTLIPNLRAALEMSAARVASLLVALAAVASLAGAAGATSRWQPQARPDFWADGNLVDVQLRVEGDAAPLYLSPKETGGSTSRRSPAATIRSCSATTPAGASVCC